MQKLNKVAVHKIEFINTYSKLPSRFFQKINPSSTSAPKIIKWNEDLALDLKISFSAKDQIDLKEIEQLFSGFKVHKSSIPLATAYSGHQFGHFSPVLGDGRAHLLGELKGLDGKLYDVQLKGSGRTEFSRSGDGRSPLGPVLREYIVSEAMYALGVSTTRSLCAVTTGETVYRSEGELAGGILTRVSESLIRVGHFEYFASRGDKEGLKTLLFYLVKRSYPDIDLKSDDLPFEFFKNLVDKQAKLVAKWMSLGFVHGVMNTDNTSALGLTIDYGPCAFLDETDLNKVFSFIDQGGRYSYKNQPVVLRWNLARLAESLLEIYSDDEERNTKAQNYTKILEGFLDLYETYFEKLMFKKLGFKESNSIKSEDERLEKRKILNLWIKYLDKYKIDFTNAFRNLPDLFEEENDDLKLYKENENLNTFKTLWKEQLKIEGVESRTVLKEISDRVNPVYIPRNHMIEEVIKKAYENDFSLFHKFTEILKSPYIDLSDDEDHLKFSSAPKIEQRIKNTFCGT